MASSGSSRPLTSSLRIRSADLDAEAGADQRHREHRHREVLVDDVARPGAEQLLDLVAVAEQALRVLAGEAERDAAEEQARAPADQHAALEPHGEPERAQQPPVRGRRPGALGEDARALVAVGAQRDRRRTSPAVATASSASGHHCSPAYGRMRLAPADRRQPRQRAVADVAGRAQEVRGAQRGAADPYIDAVVSLICAATAATPANTSPMPASEAPSANEPATGWSRPIIAERDEQAEQQLHRGHHARAPPAIGA